MVKLKGETGFFLNIPVELEEEFKNTIILVNKYNGNPAFKRGDIKFFIMEAMKQWIENKRQVIEKRVY